MRMRCIRSRRCSPSTRSGRAIRRPRCWLPVRSSGSAFVAYSPLGRGFLTGTIRSASDLAPDDFRGSSPRFQGENLEEPDARRASRWLAARRVSRPPARAGLGARARRRHRADSRHEARDLPRAERRGRRGRAHRDEMAGLDEVFPLGAAAGTRYSEAGMRAVNL